MTAPSVPSGFVWDLRDFLAINELGQQATLLPALAIVVNGAFTVFKTPPTLSLIGVHYHLETRQIVYPSDVMVASSSAAQWSWVVSGYQLTA